MLRRIRNRTEPLPASDQVLDVIRTLEEQPDFGSLPAPPMAPTQPVPATPAAPRYVGSAHGERGLVSIVLPVYNHADLLPDAITGVVSQTYPHWELIVVDDGSSDDFDAAVQPFLGDSRIRISLSRTKSFRLR